MERPKRDPWRIKQGGYLRRSRSAERKLIEKKILRPPLFKES